METAERVDGPEKAAERTDMFSEGDLLTLLGIFAKPERKDCFEIKPEDACDVPEFLAAIGNDGREAFRVSPDGSRRIGDSSDEEERI